VEGANVGGAIAKIGNRHPLLAPDLRGKGQPVGNGHGAADDARCHHHTALRVSDVHGAAFAFARSGGSARHFGPQHPDRHALREHVVKAAIDRADVVLIRQAHGERRWDRFLAAGRVVRRHDLAGLDDGEEALIVLLDELERWTGDRALVEELEMEAKAALRWIDDYGDRNGDGYVDYQRHMETGLENQCWKDSWNSILFADGSNSKLPRATAEIQGYVYDAKLRGARMARLFWNDAALADRLEREAEDLKRRFNRDYWIEERGHFALAIDGDGRKVDSLTSNIGHLLWSGIVDQEHAADCVEKLLSDRLYSGWGIRTMAEGEGAYNPIGYHIGTVWPHDNSIIALGLARYGYREEAATIAMGILEAATFFHERLPEAFAGFRRDMTRFPVEYPTACSPQAWATGAPLLLLRVLLGLEPVGEHLIVDPHLPKQIGWLQILDIPGRWGRTDAFARVRES